MFRRVRRYADWAAREFGPEWREEYDWTRKIPRKGREFCVEAGSFMEEIYPHVLECRLRMPNNPKAEQPGSRDLSRFKKLLDDPHCKEHLFPMDPYDEAIYRKFLLQRHEQALKEDAIAASRQNVGPLRAISKRDITGRMITKFHGAPGSCWNQFKAPYQFVKAFNGVPVF